MPAPNDSLHAAAEEGDIDRLNRFLAEGEPVDSRDPEGRTPLMYAIHGEQTIAVRHLLKWGAAVDIQALSMQTPLQMASRSGNVEIVRLLLAQGADPNQIVHPKATPLTRERAERMIEISKDIDGLTCTPPKTVETMMAESEIAPPAFRNGVKTLMAAISSGSIDTVITLLDAGIDTGPGERRHLSGIEKTISGMRPLKWAVSMGTVEMVRTLIQHGVDVNGGEDEPGVTALGSAVMKGNLELARVLLEMGAKPNTGTMSPLYHAIFHDNREMVDLLLRFGAEVSGMIERFADDKPEIAAMLERHQGTDWHRAVEGDEQDKVRARLDSGTSPDTRTGDGETALHLAAKQGRVNIAKLLIERGADVNVASNVGQTPLMNAAVRNHSEIVQLLLRNGAEVNAVNQFGHTALYTLHGDDKREIREMLLDAGARVGIVEAALLGDVLRVRAFLDTGSPVDSRNMAGMTPLMAASLHNEVALATMLHDWGADINARDNRQETPLFYAARSSAPEGDIALLHKLIEWGAEVDAEAIDGATPLERSFSRDNNSRMTFLLDHGADANYQARRGSEKKLIIPLLYHAIRMASVLPEAKAVRILLDHGADVNVPQSFGERPSDTPLIMALELAGLRKNYGQIRGEERAEKMLPVLRLLIERGADVNARAPMNKGVLRLAIETRSVETVRLILESGHNWEDGGADALMWAAPYPGIAAFLRERGAIEKDASNCNPLLTVREEAVQVLKSSIPTRATRNTFQKRRWSGSVTEKE